MKHRDLVRKLTAMGCTLVRHGKAHDWWTNPETRQSQPVPRHREIHEQLAKSILRKLGGE